MSKIINTVNTANLEILEVHIFKQVRTERKETQRGNNGETRYALN